MSFKLWNRRRDAPAADQDGAEKSVEFAWQIHTAVSQWSGRADTKASIVLSLELATLGVITAFSRDRGPLAELSGVGLLSYKAGLALLGLSIFLAGIVVFPQLRRRRLKKTWQLNPIYFGHLRKWQPTELAQELERLSSRERLEMLSRQLVATARVTWIKNNRLQWSMGLAFFSIVLIAAPSIA
jgi:hypothetical protein